MNNNVLKYITSSKFIHEFKIDIIETTDSNIIYKSNEVSIEKKKIKTSLKVLEYSLVQKI
ncbi:hypothetical protein EDC18_10795 [Natranaerovirga pectinivora]|uniref:Uncharacterized protein n=1 Tax=Natranaerovirga pectinivora TaxID=682400 RepID=A0A4R3MKB7_9FIRM|nr:hypothetical protein [Natranaerovirga pectinivora]TCT14026.1 hypothetical protein EDC18_10795 [Natranaerovirga pectinivora]